LSTTPSLFDPLRFAAEDRLRVEADRVREEAAGFFAELRLALDAEREPVLFVALAVLGKGYLLLAGLRGSATKLRAESRGTTGRGDGLIAYGD
jgi:hypothetical protein